MKANTVAKTAPTNLLVQGWRICFSMESSSSKMCQFGGLAGARRGSVPREGPERHSSLQLGHGGALSRLSTPPSMAPPSSASIWMASQPRGDQQRAEAEALRGGGGAERQPCSAPDTCPAGSEHQLMSRCTLSPSQAICIPHDQTLNPLQYHPRRKEPGQLRKVLGAAEAFQISQVRPRPQGSWALDLHRWGRG